MVAVRKSGCIKKRRRQNENDLSRVGQMYRNHESVDQMYRNLARVGKMYRNYARVGQMYGYHIRKNCRLPLQIRR